MAGFDIGVIGLAVMGQNLVLNMSDHGYKVAVYNRTTSVMEDFIGDQAKGREIQGARTLEELVAFLESPRLVMLMVKAGKPVDLVIKALTPLLDPGDVIIDGGNSFFGDTIRRCRELKTAGIYFVGAGVSGGELGARFGPSIMPGGAPEAWPLVKNILQAISAKVDGDVPCCEWMGSDGAGHYVKMVHNGIEYGFLQLIAESYHLMKSVVGLDNEAMAGVFRHWSGGKLGAYLIEATADVLAIKDKDGEPLLGKIVDAAGQKGTGRWTSESALQLGIPLTLVTEAVFARALSALKDERVKVSQSLPAPEFVFTGDKQVLLDDLENALYLSEIISYAQGFMLFRAAAAEFGWDLDYATIANIWRNGCIIRSELLTHIRDAYEQDAALTNLLLDGFFKDEFIKKIRSLREIAGIAARSGTAAPAYYAALSFFDGYRSAVLPANLIQALRDYFGGHTYERLDAPRGQFFHTDWTGEGGDITASSYTA